MAPEAKFVNCAARVHPVSLSPNTPVNVIISLSTYTVPPVVGKNDASINGNSVAVAFTLDSNLPLGPSFATS